MESTKIWKDTQNILKKNLPEIIREISDFYPPEQFFDFYKSMAEHLHAISIFYVVQEGRTKEDFLAFSQEYFPEKIRGMVKGTLKRMAEKLERYKSAISPESLKEYYKAEKLGEKKTYIS